MIHANGQWKTKKALREAAMPRKQRIALLRQAIDEHRENREQYTFVMRGCRRGLKPMGLLTVKG